MMTRRTVIGKSQVSEIIDVNVNVKIHIPNNENLQTLIE